MLSLAWPNKISYGLRSSDACMSSREDPWGEHPGRLSLMTPPPALTPLCGRHPGLWARLADSFLHRRIWKQWWHGTSRMRLYQGWGLWLGFPLSLSVRSCTSGKARRGPQGTAVRLDVHLLLAEQLRQLQTERYHKPTVAATRRFWARTTQQSCSWVLEPQKMDDNKHLFFSVVQFCNNFDAATDN